MPPRCSALADASTYQPGKSVRTTRATSVTHFFGAVPLTIPEAALDEHNWWIEFPSVSDLESDISSVLPPHNGDDLSKNGADVFGDGATSQNGNFIRAVWQFVGSASGGWNGVGIQMGNSETMRVLSGNQNLDSSDAGIATVLNNHPVIGLNTDVSATFASGGNAARALLHESLHLKYPGFEFTVSSHQWIDTEARRLLKVYGLGDGGCNAVGGLFGTDWFASFPACK